MFALFVGSLFLVVVVAAAAVIVVVVVAAVVDLFVCSFLCFFVVFVRCCLFAVSLFFVVCLSSCVSRFVC